jgi:hypothetical protein
MELKKRVNRNRSLGIAAAILIIGLGCLCMPTGIIPTSTPTVPPTNTPIILPVDTNTPPPPPPTDTPAPTAEANGLNADGPWLLIESSQGLWAVNQDGSGLTQLTTVDYWHGEIQQAIQPGGSLVVFISPADYQFQNMSLNLLKLPGGKVSKITDLTSAQTEAYSASAPGDPGFEALRAVGERSSYAWSPDGTRLAFAGVMDGPSAEIYLYDVQSQKIQRVSQDEAQDFSPSWSPDGNHMLYLGAEGFGTGAGFVMAGVWAAAGDGSNVTQLYATKSSGEDIIGWLNDSTAVLDTWSIICGPSKLRLYDVTSNQQTMLNEDCITSAAASTDWHNEVMFSTDSALYMLTADNPQPNALLHAAGARIAPWGPDDYVFTVRFENGGIATYGSGDFDFQVPPVEVSSSMDWEVAMYGAIWGWTSSDAAQPGAWISGPGVEIGQIYQGRASFPAWSPHNNLLFFAMADSGGYDLMLTTFDAYYTDLYKVNHIDTDVMKVVWLGPR